MLTKDDSLAVARNPLHNDVVRLGAWRAYETECWLEAHEQRNLRICDLPVEYRERVYDLIKARALRPFVSR